MPISQMRKWRFAHCVSTLPGESHGHWGVEALSGCISVP